MDHNLQRQAEPHARSVVDANEKSYRDHSTHTPLVDSGLTEANLLDAVVCGTDDEKIGAVSHMHGMGPATQVIVNVGGFLGTGAKPVARTPNQLTALPRTVTPVTPAPHCP